MSARSDAEQPMTVEDTRMQNIAMTDLMEGGMRERNLALFEKILGE